VKDNDELSPYFGSFKGVKLGEPLSPFLFHVDGESLAKMVDKAQQDGSFSGLEDNLFDRGISILHMLMIPSFLSMARLRGPEILNCYSISLKQCLF
jgi:hypothetical protein